MEAEVRGSVIPGNVTHFCGSMGLSLTQQLFLSSQMLLHVLPCIFLSAAGFCFFSNPQLCQNSKMPFYPLSAWKPATLCPLPATPKSDDNCGIASEQLLGVMLELHPSKACWESSCCGIKLCSKMHPTCFGYWQFQGTLEDDWRDPWVWNAGCVLPRTLTWEIRWSGEGTFQRKPGFFLFWLMPILVQFYQKQTLSAVFIWGILCKHLLLTEGLQQRCLSG